MLEFTLSLARPHPDVLLHFVFPLCCAAFLVAWQLAEAGGWHFRKYFLGLGLIFAWAQWYARVEQEVVLWVLLGDLPRDAHRAQVHLVDVLPILLRGRLQWRRPGRD